jgi:hypothetical protein
VVPIYYLPAFWVSLMSGWRKPNHSPSFLSHPQTISLSNVGSIITGEYRPIVSLVLDYTVGLTGGLFKIIPGRLVSPLEIYFIAAALVAFITVIPIIGYEIYAYVNPALYPHEKRLVWPFLAAFLTLFAAGAAFSYLIVVPLVIRFMAIFADIVGIEPELRLIEAERRLDTGQILPWPGFTWTMTGNTRPRRASGPLVISILLIDCSSIAGWIVLDLTLSVFMRGLWPRLSLLVRPSPLSPCMQRFLEPRPPKSASYTRLTILPQTRSSPSGAF